MVHLHCRPGSAAFDMESGPAILWQCPREKGVSSNVQRIVQAIFAEAMLIGQQDRGGDMSRPFNTERGALWCDGGPIQRSRVDSLPDKTVKSSKRRTAEASLDKVMIGSHCAPIRVSGQQAARRR